MTYEMKINIFHYTNKHIAGLMQDCGNPIVNALELL